MYLCIYIATHLHTVCLDRQRAIRGAPDNQDRVNSEIHTEAVIERVWRCNWRPRVRELRDALGGRDRVSLDMHL